MKYPGGKNGSGVYQWIINQIPPHRVYCELFLGSGAVMRYKRPAERNIGIEIDPGAIAAFVEAAGGHDVDGDAAFRRSGSGNAASGDRRSPETAATAASGVADRLAMSCREVTLATCGDCARVEVFAFDALRWLELYGDLVHFDWFVYADPPYLPSTLRQGRAPYRCRLDGIAHHHLLSMLKRLPCLVAISGYDSPLYRHELADWRTDSYETMTRGGHATEWLWMNYPAPTALHDYRYLGSGFRQRENLGKQRRRWLARLNKMDRLQRQMLLAAIDDVFGTATPPSASPAGHGDNGEVSSSPGGIETNGEGGQPRQKRRVPRGSAKTARGSRK